MNVVIELESAEEILSPLRQAGVKRAVVTYCGGGDEGYIDNIETEPSVPRASLSLEADLEPVFDHLPDWVNNEGGGGSITIDVATGSITVQHYQNETVQHHEVYKIITADLKAVAAKREAQFDRVLSDLQTLIDTVPTEVARQLLELQTDIFALRDAA